MQAQMTPGQARVVDPVLTDIARGYISEFSPAADILFPVVTVDARAGQILEFTNEDYRLVNSQRAPGANTLRIAYGYSKSAYGLVDFRLEGSVPDELNDEAKGGPGIDLLEGAVKTVQNQMAREREMTAATLATDLSKFGASNKTTLSGTSQWSNPGSDPFGDINNAKETIRQQIGRRPNDLVLAPRVATALRSNAKILDRLSTATDRPPATMAQLATLFELDRITVADGTYYDGTRFLDMWGTDAVLAYTTPRSAAAKGAPNFGYTYQLRGYPVVTEAYLDRNPNTWAQPVADARQVYLVGPSAGFLFKAAAAPAA